MRILVIDVGNTNIVYGIFEKEKLIYEFRISTSEKKTNDEYGMIFYQTLKAKGIKIDTIEGIIISSVVPNVMHTLETMSIKYFNINPLIVTSDIKTGIKLKYQNPKEIGADRIVNAVAVSKMTEKNAIIIDMGTAITFCYLTDKKEYMGGLIIPGIGISADALTTRTAKLPKIEIIKAEKVICDETVESMQAGLYFGYRKMIEGIIDKIFGEKQLKAENTEIFATGGFAPLLTKNLKYPIKIERELTLKGLMELYKLNTKNK